MNTAFQSNETEVESAVTISSTTTTILPLTKPLHKLLLPLPLFKKTQKKPDRETVY